MNQKVELANQFILEHRNTISEKYRSHYHFMAPIGWINDPNGFVYYQGAYHLFYQYYPYDSQWGPMHWGHAKSVDLIHWEHLPVALAPDEDYDADGCFSGSAIARDGKLFLVYTGHVEQDGACREVQCLAVSEDGIRFKKYANNPIISDEHLIGLDADISDFRDPKVIEHDGSYYCLVASKTAEDLGQILLFKSDDLIDWQYFSVLLTGETNQGTMWECPDLFHLDGQDILILSPIDMAVDGVAYENINSSVAFIGKVDWSSGTFIVENYHEIDSGLDFYAPQTCLGPDDKRMMIAWMQMWQRTLPTHDLKHGWAGAMTLPRVLSVEENRLIQKPIPIDRQTQTKKITLFSEESILINDMFSDSCYLKFELDISQSSSLSIALAQSKQSALTITYDGYEALVTFDRTGFGIPLIGKEKTPLNKRSIQLADDSHDILVIECYRDTNSIELFVNNGLTLTSTFYEIDQSQDIEITAVGALYGEITYAKIKL